MEDCIRKIREATARDTLEVRLHARKRMAQRNVIYADVCAVVLNGIVVEKYPKSYPYPSCLFMDFVKDEPLYVVCSWDGEKAYLITVHWLDPQKWVSPWTRRRK